MNDESQTLDPAVYERLQQAVQSAGPVEAAALLCAELDAAGDYQGLFYARLLKARVEMGVSPFPTGPANELPESTHEAYEVAIRSAGQEVGQRLIAKGDLARAWGFYRMLGDTESMKQALDAWQPGPDDDTYAAIDIAWQQGVHPQKGFDLVLDRQGICSAITMVGSADLSRAPDVRDYCVKRLIRSLTEQLAERLRNDLESRGLKPSANAGVGALVALEPEKYGEEVYHIDLSHLQSVVQYSTTLPACEELGLVRELCQYGEKLSSRLIGDTQRPFDEGYADYRRFFDIIAGENVDANLNHFINKLDDAAAEGDLYAVEFVVNLLLRLDRLTDALTIAQKYLAEGNSENCPPVVELARRAKDYATLSRAAQQASDPVNYLAGLIAGMKQ